MGHKGYYGQYTGNSKFSKKHDVAYDAKEAYNKDLTASARLHYLENDRHDHESPAKFIRKKKRGEAGFEQDPQEARYESQSRRMEKKEKRKAKRKAKRNAAAQKHCMN